MLKKSKENDSSEVCLRLKRELIELKKGIRDIRKRLSGGGRRKVGRFRRNRRKIGRRFNSNNFRNRIFS